MHLKRQSFCSKSVQGKKKQEQGSPAVSSLYGPMSPCSGWGEHCSVRDLGTEEAARFVLGALMLCRATLDFSVCSGCTGFCLSPYSRPWDVLCVCSDSLCGGGGSCCFVIPSLTMVIFTKWPHPRVGHRWVCGTAVYSRAVRYYCIVFIPTVETVHSRIIVY